MPLLTPEIVYRRWSTMGVPDSKEHMPAKAEIIQLLNMLFGVSRGGWVVAKTAAELNGVTPAAETDGGVVLTGAGAGYYQRDAGVWVRERGFPDTAARLVGVAGSGNAPTASTAPGVDPGQAVMLFFTPRYRNTGAMTLSVNGVAAKPLLTFDGLPMEEDFLAADATVPVYDNGTEYRLLWDHRWETLAAQTRADRDEVLTLKEATELLQSSASTSAGMAQAAADAAFAVQVPDNRIEKTVTTAMHGIVGDGTDETIKFRNFVAAITNGCKAVISPIVGPHILLTGPITSNGKVGVELRGNDVPIRYNDPTVVADGQRIGMRFANWNACLVTGIDIDLINQNSQQTALSIHSSSLTLISGNKVNNARWVGIAVEADCDGVRVIGNDITFCRFGVFNSGKNTKINDNEITMDWANTAEGIAKGGVWSAPSLYYDGILIGNGGVGWEIVGNHIWGCGQSGIYTGTGVESGLIQGNRIHDNFNKGVDIGPGAPNRTKDIRVLGNECRNNRTGDIHLYRADSCIVMGNTVQSDIVSGSFGIALNDANFDCIVAFNTIDVDTIPSIFINDAGSFSARNFLYGNVILGSGPVTLNRTRNQSFQLNGENIFTAAQKVDISASGLSGAASRKVLELVAALNDGTGPNGYAQVVSNLPVRFTTSGGGPLDITVGALQANGAATLTTSLFMSSTAWLSLPRTAQGSEGRIWYDLTKKTLVYWNGGKEEHLREGAEGGILANRPAAGPAFHKKISMLDGGAGVAEILQVCAKNADGSYSWKNIPFS